MLGLVIQPSVKIVMPGGVYSAVGSRTVTVPVTGCPKPSSQGGGLRTAVGTYPVQKALTELAPC